MEAEAEAEAELGVAGAVRCTRQTARVEPGKGGQRAYRVHPSRVVSRHSQSTPAHFPLDARALIGPCGQCECPVILPRRWQPSG